MSAARRPFFAPASAVWCRFRRRGFLRIGFVGKIGFRAGGIVPVGAGNGRFRRRSGRRLFAISAAPATPAATPALAGKVFVTALIGPALTSARAISA